MTSHECGFCQVCPLREHGVRKARYFGLTKLNLQALWTASVLNLKRLFTWLKTEPAGIRCDGQT